MPVLTKWGNSQGIRLTAAQCKELGWSTGDALTVSIERDEAGTWAKIAPATAKKRIGALASGKVPSVELWEQLDAEITAEFEQAVSR